MFRGTVTVIASCALLAITLRQYLDVPGQSDRGQSIAAMALAMLRNDGLHQFIPYDSASLALMTGASSALIVAVTIKNASH